MNKRAFLMSGVAITIAVGGALLIQGRQTQAQPLPLE